MDDLIDLLLWAMMLGFYILPTLVAWLQQHHQLHAIGALNLLLGWTLLGWIGALLWVFTANRAEPRPHSLGQKHHRKHRKPTARRLSRRATHSDLARRLTELKPMPTLSSSETCHL